ncbi:unnamed protein product [Caenorhabditis auriculariae]|uniref:Tyrosine-protein phosphatase domain-containing protein n=1 Tax=Caenorhabditis auriculariae TaxID=2777116 RepID=A0A8S1HK49_9PELO|nr:unnamed protein product [Caenorhabditis auriculariae]
MANPLKTTSAPTPAIGKEKEQEETEETTPKEAMMAIAAEPVNLLADMHAAAMVFPPTFENFFNDLTLNRCPHLLCYDHTRVVLNDDLDKGNYYNASFVDSYKNKGGYVFSQAPFNDRTTGDFWRLVINVKPSIIIVMGSIDEAQGNKVAAFNVEIDNPEWSNKFLALYGASSLDDATSKLHIPKYFWPMEAGATSKFCKEKTIQVKLESINNDRHMNTYNLVVTAKKETNNLALVHFHQWMDESPLPEYISDLRAMVKITMVRKAKNPGAFKGPMLLVCPTGINRCGSYAALDIVTARIADERNVGVRETMIAIKSQRYGCFRSVDHYQIIREILLRTCITSGVAHDEAIGEKLPSKKQQKKKKASRVSKKPKMFKKT